MKRQLKLNSFFKLPTEDHPSVDRDDSVDEETHKPPLKKTTKRRSFNPTEDHSSVDLDDSVDEETHEPPLKKATKRRSFNPDWELSYFVVECSNKPHCLLCGENISVCKAYNVKRHYQSVHTNHGDTFKSKTTRMEKLNQLKSQLNEQQEKLSSAISTSELATLASYKISWLVAREKKPFSDIELIKKCIIEAMDVLTGGLRTKDEIMSRVNKMQLSRRTFVRRISDMSSDLVEQLKRQLNDCVAFSLALDDSTDITDVSQLCVWIRFVDKDLSVNEELLALRSLHGQTRGKDILEVVLDLVKEFELSLDKLVSVTTDGAPSMIGKNVGFVTLFKEIVQHRIYTFHCIIHQQALSSKVSDDRLNSVMSTVVSIVNHIRARALNHRQFVDFLQSVESEYGDLILHNDIRWLSRGKVLKRFVKLLSHINDFLDSKHIHSYDMFLCDVEWVRDLSFLADMTEHLNELNTNLQGRTVDVFDAYASIKVFMRQLDLFSQQMKDEDLRHFEELQASITEEPLPSPSFDRYVACIDNIRENFCDRFKDFQNLTIVQEFLQNPLVFPLAKVQKIAEVFHIDSACLETDIINMQIRNLSLMSPTVKISTVGLLVAKVRAIFSSTYSCEVFFSALKVCKSKYRSLISDSNLENELRCAVAQKMEPRFHDIVKSKDCQIAH